MPVEALGELLLVEPLEQQGQAVVELRERLAGITPVQVAQPIPAVAVVRHLMFLPQQQAVLAALAS
jgi:hypothetical protein